MPRGKIYKITNLVNQKIYIGCTVNSLEKRFCEHIYRGLKTDSNCKLYNSIKKYNIENFKIELIEECDLSNIYEREIFYIDKYDTYKNGLNSTYGGEGCLGYVHSPEIRKKISKILLESENTHKGKTYEELYGNKCANEKNKRKISVKKTWDDMSLTDKIKRTDEIKNSLRKKSKYGEELVRSIKNDIKNNLSRNEILKKYPSINTSYYYDLKNKRVWSDFE